MLFVSSVVVSVGLLLLSRVVFFDLQAARVIMVRNKRTFFMLFCFKNLKFFKFYRKRKWFNI